MIEDQITAEPTIHSILQQYPQSEWNRVLKALSILGIQTLGNLNQNKFYTVDELEQLVNSQNSMRASQEIQNNNDMIIKEEEEITTSMANKDIEQHINHKEQENEPSQTTPKAVHKEVNVQHEHNMKQPLSYSYQNNQYQRTNVSYSPRVELNASSNLYTYNSCTSCHCNWNCYGHHWCSSHCHCHHHHHCNDDCIYCRCYCDDCISRRVRLRMLSSSNPSLSMNYSVTNSYNPPNRY